VTPRRGSEARAARAKLTTGMGGTLTERVGRFEEKPRLEDLAWLRKENPAGVEIRARRTGSEHLPWEPAGSEGR
jgi:hypothetical protein